MVWVTMTTKLLLLMVATAAHECSDPKDIPAGAYTPVFDFGDNWSFQDCGKWSDKSKAAPWRIAVGRQDGATCFGILLSDYNFITSQCMEVANDFRKDSASVKAYTGLCYDQKVQTGDAAAECKDNNQGQRIQIKSISILGNDTGATQLHLWQLMTEATNITPICLFNKNQNHVGGYNGQSRDCSIYSRKWMGKFLAIVGGAPSFSSSRAELCVKTSSGKDASSEQNFSGDFLVIAVKERLMLRGFFSWPIHDGKYFTYTDVAPFIKELITKSYDMYKMPDVPEAKKKTDFSKAPTLNKRGVCGKVASLDVRSSRPRRDAVKEVLDHVINGVDSEVGEFPWHASISYRPVNTPIDKYDFCGATLISNRVAITAAHCLIDPKSEQVYSSASDLQISLGMHNNAVNDDMHQLIRVERILMHPNYSRHTKVYDVALLFLKEDANLTSRVRPICLWDDDYDLDKIKDKLGTVVGWGSMEVGKTRRMRPSILQFGHLSAKSHADCYKTEKNVFGKYLHPGINFCAIGSVQNKSVAACQGDSGGSFIINKNSTWFLRGVVSFGILKNIKIDSKYFETCDEKYPSLYTDLGCAMKWIVKEVAISGH